MSVLLQTDSTGKPSWKASAEEELRLGKIILKDGIELPLGSVFKAEPLSRGSNRFITIFNPENELKIKEEDIKETKFLTQEDLEKIHGVAVDTKGNRYPLDQVFTFTLDGSLYSFNYENLIIQNGINNVSISKSDIEEISLPKSLKSINPYALQEFTSLKKISLNDGLEDIGQYAFDNCTKLESITFPTSLKEIGKSAFSYCKNLKSINNLENTKVQELKENTFSECHKLDLKEHDLDNILFFYSMVFSATSVENAVFDHPIGIEYSIFQDNGGKLKSVTFRDGASFPGREEFISNCKNNYHIDVKMGTPSKRR